MKKVYLAMFVAIVLSSCSVLVKNTPLPVTVSNQPVDVNVKNNPLPVTLNQSVDVNVKNFPPPLIPKSETSFSFCKNGLVGNGTYVTPLDPAKTAVVKSIYTSEFGTAAPEKAVFLVINPDGTKYQQAISGTKETYIVLPPGAQLKISPTGSALPTAMDILISGYYTSN